MASGLQPHLDSLKLDDLADIVSYLCLMPRVGDNPITPRLVKQQKRGVLEKLIADFIKNPTEARERTSKAKSVMVKENAV